MASGPNDKRLYYKKKMMVTKVTAMYSMESSTYLDKSYFM
jgi:hypothetical protein